MFLENRGDKMVKFSLCGHMGYQGFDINLWGVEEDRIKFNVDDKNIRKEGEELVTDKMCGQCILEDLRKSSIRCCFCGRVIIPGSLVGLYPAIKGNKEFIRFEPTYIDNNVVACCDCGGAATVGYWLGKKEDGKFLIKYIF